MKTAIAFAVLVAAVLAPLAGHAQEAEIEAEIGWVSEYYYRGIPQATSSASAGVEVGMGGLYAGTWAADVGEGAEIDLYGGYALDLEGLSLGAGATGYFYTGDFDDTYLEANLFAGFGPLEAEFSLGQWQAFDAPPQDYLFFALTAAHEGGYFTVGSFGGDFSGNYAELGYGFSVSELDMQIAWIWSDEELSGRGRDDHTIVLGVSTTIGIR